MSNTRKFQIYDEITLYEACTSALQILTDIEAMADEAKKEKKDPEPITVVDTQELYNICASLKAAYDKLLEEHLVNTGNPRRPSKKLH